MAMQHHHEGRFAEAEAAYRELLAAHPDHVDALHLLGFLAHQLGQNDRAVELIGRALALNPLNAPAHCNLGKVYHAQDRLDPAIASHRKALELSPGHVEAHVHLGHAFAARAQLAAAAACYREALTLTTVDPAIHYALGTALYAQGLAAESIACFRAALALNPDFPEALCDLGSACKLLNRVDEAIEHYRHALKVKPDFFVALFNLGIACRDKGAREEALACFERALGLQPDSAAAHYCIGHTLADEDRLDEARPCFLRALSADPDFAEARWSLAMSCVPRVYGSGEDPVSVRATFAAELEALESWFDRPSRIARGPAAVGADQPFALAYQEEDNRGLLQRYGVLCARLMAQCFTPQPLPDPANRASGGALRIGVVSQYFRDHSVWNALMKGWFRQLDPERFALFAFYVGTSDDRETMYARSRAARFFQGTFDLPQWADQITQQRPDVLIYPEIGMDPMTLRLASLRLAPVQIATWGHPETTGLPTIDYYLSAQDLEPPGAAAHYSEQLVALPHLGCCVEGSAAPAAPCDLHQWGLDPQRPLLVCPGTPFKYAPRHDRVLTEIAQRLGDCQFIFFQHWTRRLSDQLQRRLRAAFAQAGLRFERHVVFIPWQPRQAFHGLMQRADVFLDTIGFSGFNTALQAVQCGLPIVTRDGLFLRGRLASGILKRMGLRDLVAVSDADYIALAVRLAKDAAFRETVRERMRAARHLLFDDLAPIRALEEFLLRASGR